jgi:hypothetical protein
VFCGQILRSHLEVAADLSFPADSTIRNLSFVIRDARNNEIPPRQEWFTQNGLAGFRVSSNWQPAQSSKSSSSKSSKRKYKYINVSLDQVSGNCDIPLPDIKLPKTCGVEEYELEVMLAGLSAPFVVCVRVNVLPSENRSWKVITAPHVRALLQAHAQTASRPSVDDNAMIVDDQSNRAEDVGSLISIMVGDSKDFSRHILGIACYDEFNNVVDFASSSSSSQMQTPPVARLKYEYPPGVFAQSSSSASSSSSSEAFAAMIGPRKRARDEQAAAEDQAVPDANNVDDDGNPADDQADIEYPLVASRSSVSAHTQEVVLPLMADRIALQTVVVNPSQTAGTGDDDNSNSKNGPQTVSYFKFAEAVRLLPVCLPVTVRLVVTSEHDDDYGGDSLTMTAARGFPRQCTLRAPSLDMHTPPATHTSMTTPAPVLSVRAYTYLSDLCVVLLDECGFRAKMPTGTAVAAASTGSTTSKQSGGGESTVRVEIVNKHGTKIVATTAKGRALESNEIAMKPFVFPSDTVTSGSNRSASVDSLDDGTSNASKRKKSSKAEDNNMETTDNNEPVAAAAAAAAEQAVEVEANTHTSIYQVIVKYSVHGEAIIFSCPVSVHTLPINNVVDMIVDKFVCSEDDVWVEEYGNSLKITSNSHFPIFKITLPTGDGGTFVPPVHTHTNTHSTDADADNDEQAVGAAHTAATISERVAECISLSIKVDEFGATQKRDIDESRLFTREIRTQTHTPAANMDEDELQAHTASGSIYFNPANVEDPHTRGHLGSEIVYGTYYFKFVFKESRADILAVTALKDKRKMERQVSVTLLPPIGEFLFSPELCVHTQAHAQAQTHAKQQQRKSDTSSSTGLFVSLASGSKAAQRVIANNVYLHVCCHKKVADTLTAASNHNEDDMMMIQLNQDGDGAGGPEDAVSIHKRTTYRGMLPSNCGIICRLAPTSSANTHHTHYPAVPEGFPTLENAQLIRCRSLAHTADTNSSSSNSIDCGGSSFEDVYAVVGEQLINCTAAVFNSVTVNPMAPDKQQPLQFKDKSIQLIFEAVEFEPGTLASVATSSSQLTQSSSVRTQFPHIPAYSVSVNVTTDDGIAELNSRAHAIEEEIKAFEAEKQALVVKRRELENRKKETLQLARTNLLRFL